MERIKETVLNCPNCGAPITGATCEYCGTIFYDFANLEIGKPVYIRMKVNDSLLIFKAIVTNADFQVIGNEPIFYMDSQPVILGTSENYEMDVHFVLTPDDRGVIFEKRKRDQCNA